MPCDSSGRQFFLLKCFLSGVVVKVLNQVNVILSAMHTTSSTIVPYTKTLLSPSTSFVCLVPSWSLLLQKYYIL